MRKTMIALMVGLAVLVVFGPKASMAGSNVSFGFYVSPGVAPPPVVYNPYYVPPPVVYNPYVTGFGFSFGPSYPRHHHLWWRHHRHYRGRGHRHGPPVHTGGW